MTFQIKIDRLELLRKVEHEMSSLQKALKDKVEMLFDGALVYEQKEKEIEKHWALQSLWHQTFKRKPRPIQGIYLGVDEKVVLSRLRDCLALGPEAEAREQSIKLLPKLGVRRITMDDGTGLAVSFYGNANLCSLKTSLEKLSELHTFYQTLDKTTSDEVYIDSTQLEKLEQYAKS